MKLNTIWALLGVGALAWTVCAVCESVKPGLTACDCVQVRYVTDLVLNRQGTKVAYLVKAPDIEQNRNRFTLYERGLTATRRDAGTIVASGDEISDVRWMGDGRRLSLLMDIQHAKAIVVVDAVSGKREILSDPKGISAYSMDDAGDTVVYAVDDAPRGTHLASAHTKDEIARGYRVTLGVTKETGTWPASSLFIRHRTKVGIWGPTSQDTVEDPFSHRSVAHFRAPDWITLSPDGKHLALDYWTETDLIPDEWKTSPWVRYLLPLQPFMKIMVIENLVDQSTKLAIKTLIPDSGPLWARDSGSFLVNAHSPVGSRWEKDDIRENRVSGLDANMFRVDAVTGDVEEVFRHVPYHHEGALAWRDDGDIVIHAPGDQILRLHRDEGEWREIDRKSLPRSADDRFGSLQSTGDSVVGVHESVTVPQDLFVYSPGQSEISVLTDLNPQLRTRQFAPVRTVHWRTSEGLEISGLLFMPPDYTLGRRYPLVIQTKGDQGWFTCDSGFTHDPAFAPQPLANAGIMYLVRTTAEGFRFQDEIDARPKDYPGGIGEAVQEMDIWDSAVKALSDQGVVDPAKVGIIGFSRTGWNVEFMLTQSPIHFAAVSAADFMQASLSEYWLIPTAQPTEEGIYGGPPYGKTLDNWKKYSISFNLEKVHTPFLMEQMGHGSHDDVEGSKPVDLMLDYEIFRGLRRLNKPVELYYYPDEDHTPDNPKARVASVQRNVDWYRFWLQGYEDPAEDKKEQYIRWRTLKNLQAEDLEESSHDHPVQPAPTH